MRAAAVVVPTVFLSAVFSQAQSGRFDLAGPRVDVRVTRAGKTLPIAAVPNLQAGDKIWMMADLPRTQSVHYLLVVAFLRGTTNPPPDKWFTKIETWDKKVREEGASVIVPDEAQQALMFLAPETGGDFSTLRSAVQGRPGIFVRASQDLNEAGFEQQRIEKYTESIKKVSGADPKSLQEHSTFLARTLNLKVNQDCFSKAADQQYNCLAQSGTQTLLSDGHGQTVASRLTSDDTANFISAASYTSMGGGGLYSAYVGAIVDLVKMTTNLHTAQYQYIPAIAFPKEEEMNLRLNAAPSFHNPKSVIVIGLPSVQAAIPPPLRAADAKHITCLLAPSVILPVEGAPLVFSTGFAHDLYLHVTGGTPQPDIPLVADAFKGGLVLAPVSKRRALPTPGSIQGEPLVPNSEKDASISANPTDPGAPHTPVSGTVIGYWGFDTFTGPTLPLQDFPGTGWKLSSRNELIAGRDNHLNLASTGTACIDKITFERADGRQVDLNWKTTDQASTVDVTLPLKSVDPGSLHVDVHQFGGNPTATVTAHSFSEPAQLAGLTLNAGDQKASLTGSSLGQVQQIKVNDVTFSPQGEPFSNGQKGSEETLALTMPDSADTGKLKAGDAYVAHVALRDGRTITLPFTVAPPRPSVTLLNKSISKPSGNPIRLTNPDDLPIGQRLTFSLRSTTPFAREVKIEIASADGGLNTNLTIASGSLVLQNSHTLLGTFDPLKSFGTSAFGPVRFRPVAPDGTAGDWLPLATLVRLPSIDSLHCPVEASQPCTVAGSSLFLIDELATDQAFTTPVDVPDGFVGDTLNIPRPPKTGFYIKLRDEPSTANLVALAPKIDRGPGAAPAAPTEPVPPPAPATDAAPTTTPGANAASPPTPAPTTSTTPQSR